MSPIRRGDAGPVRALLGLNPAGLSLFAAGYLTSVQLFLLVIAIPVLSLAVVTSQRESESHDLQVVLDTAPVAILTTREHPGRQVMANQAAYAMYMVPAGTNLSVDGSGSEQPFRLTSQGAVIPPDQLPLRRAAASGLPVTGQPLTLERADGTRRYLIGNALPLRDDDGSVRGAVGAFQDVTDMRLAEVALRESEARLRELTRRLISEQEQARTGFARDLHDDVGQRVTLIQLGLERFVQSTEGLSLEAHRRLSAILRSAEQIASDIQKMSHRLHPSTLDALGLVSALRAASREFGEKSQLLVSFSHEGHLRDIPPDVCLGLFRVAQEALTNVVKHSGVAEATLRLSGQRDRITLCVCDEGVGFDPRRVELAPLPGLGLVSMRERLNLIGGELHVRSAPSQGSEVRATVFLHRVPGAEHRE